jgi:hypothetical protein
LLAGLPFISTVGVWGEILSGKCFKAAISFVFLQKVVTFAVTFIG